jgi:hypothetical protein
MTTPAHALPRRLGDLTLLAQTRRHGKLHYECRCERCGQPTTISAAHLFTRKDRACRNCATKTRAKPRLPDTCSVCASTDHSRATCPQRPATGKPDTMCELCAGLPHRVKGIKCRTCGARYAEDVNERPLETRVGQWSWT